MYLPNYKDGSIVNLMSSIGRAFGKKMMYDELKLLPSKELKDSRNVILIVVDGLGFDYLKRKGNGTILNDNLKGSMTSVFLPTTACAITTFSTGLAPQQHAYTGWFMLLKELGIVSTILHFNSRLGGDFFSKQNVNMSDILDVPPFSDGLKAKCFVVSHKQIVDSDFTRQLGRNAKRLGYLTMHDFFSNVRKAVKSGRQRKFIYAYWPALDSISHDYGSESKKAEKHLGQIALGLDNFIKSIKGTDTTVIVTSDHGFIDSTEKELINLDSHPKLKECLSLPLCGDSRTAYCYVHTSKAKQFEYYVKTKLGRFCWVFKREDIIRKNYFGLFKPNPKLFDRIGDYVLIMKDNYLLKDSLLNQKRHFHIGNHGGVSRNEMIVPLVVIKD
jgi:predicted AlkP superfamily pyrophosphatase or phosphodiesterase